MGREKDGDRNENQQIREMQSAMADMKQKGIQIREQIEEVKSWTSIVRGTAKTPNEIIEKKIRSQIRKHKEIRKREANTIIKGLRDYGEHETTK